VGDGLADDTAAWRKAVAALAEGGTLEVAGRLRVTSSATLSVPGTRVIGAPGTTIISKGSPGLLVTASSVQITGIRFDSSSGGPSVDAGLVLRDADNVHIQGCSFGRVTLLAHSTATTVHRGLWIEGSVFDGDYTGATAPDTYNAIDVRGYEDVFVTGNRIAVKNPYRVVKLSSVLGRASGRLTSGFSSRVVISGNVISGTMSSAKQVIDLFAGTNRAIISGNIVSMAGGVGDVISTKPEGDAPAFTSVDEVGPLLIESNIIDVPAASSGVFTLAGPYALGLYNVSKPAIVAIRNNAIHSYGKPPSTQPTIQVKGFDDASLVGNQIHRGAVAFGPAILVGHVRRATVADNSISRGEIRVSEGLMTPNGTAYASGSTQQVSIRGNVITDFDAPGAVWVSSVSSLESLIIARNNIHNSEDTPQIDSVAYIDKTTIAALAVTGNLARMANAVKHRFRYGPGTKVESRIRNGNSFDVATADFDPGSVASGRSAILGPITLWGVEAGDTVSVTPPFPSSGVTAAAFVNGPNDIRVRVSNNDTKAWSPGRTQWKVKISQ
jgi:hypothetical protein